MINKEEISKIARLSRLEISEDSLASYADDIDALLEFSKINSKAYKTEEDAPAVSIDDLRCDNIACGEEVAPCDISKDASNGFYRIGEIS